MRIFKKFPVLIGLWIATTMLILPVAGGAEEGPYSFQVSNIAAGTGGSAGGKLVVPDAKGPFPLVVVSHGWASGAQYMVGWAKLFASYGMVAVVPNFPSPLVPNHKKNGQIVEDLVDIFTNPPADSPAHGKVNPKKIGLIGHSAGGLASTLAAENLQPNALVLFDPVDNSAMGKNAFPNICSPTMVIFATPGSCNNNCGWENYKDTVGGSLVSFRVQGTTHCDGEKPARAACGPFCGGAASPALQDLMAERAVAMLALHLLDDNENADLLEEGSLENHEQLTDVLIQDSAPECATPDPQDTDQDTGVSTDTDQDTGVSTDTDQDTGVSTDTGEDIGVSTDIGGEGDGEGEGEDVVSGGSADDGDCQCAMMTSTPKRGAAWLLFGLMGIAWVYISTSRRS